MERGIERLVARVQLGVRVATQCGSGSIVSRTRTQRVDGLVHVAEHAARDAAEQRGAERRPLFRLGRSSGRSSTEATIRSQSRLRAPPPETRPDRRLGAELAEQVERVAEAERDAFEDRADERTAVVAQLEPDERAARVRVGVRRALSREVRAGRQAPPSSGLPRLRLRDERARTTRRRRARSRNHSSEPAAESITPIACQVPGTA